MRFSKLAVIYLESLARVFLWMIICLTLMLCSLLSNGYSIEYQIIYNLQILVKSPLYCVWTMLMWIDCEKYCYMLRDPPTNLCASVHTAECAIISGGFTWHFSKFYSILLLPNELNILWVISMCFYKNTFQVCLRTWQRTPITQWNKFIHYFTFFFTGEGYSGNKAEEVSRDLSIADFSF